MLVKVKMLPSSSLPSIDRPNAKEYPDTQAKRRGRGRCYR